MKTYTSLVIATVAAISASSAEDSDLAKKLSNPVADLISVPLQGNFESGVGPGDGNRFTLNFQPVIPISLNNDWNVISRTILPFIDQSGILSSGAADATGLGDTVQSFFFSPKSSDPIWGIGPVFLLPTATDNLLGADQFGIGPTAVVLKQDKAWTYGILANHIWGVAGDDDGPEVNATFLQPFVSYALAPTTTLTFNSESTYDWENEQWTIPLYLGISQIIKLGGQPVSIFGGFRYFVEKPTGAPDWGIRLGMTFLFPNS